MTYPKVSIIIVNWNGKRWLKDCLSSVFNQIYPNYEVILVDNASTDSSVEYVRENFPEAEIIVNKENLGWCGGNNIGIERADGELIVLLNNDTIVEKNWLEELVKAVISDDKIGAAGSIECGISKGGGINLVGAGMPIFDINKKITPVFCPNGASLIYKRKIFNSPLLDPDYFMLGDDVYIGWQLHLKGYDVIYTPSSIITHFGGVSTKRRGIFAYYDDRNRLINVLLFYEFSTLLKTFPLLIISFSLNILSNPKDKLKIIPYIVKNINIIRKKRKKIQSERRVPDKDIIKYITYKLTEKGGYFYKTINKLTYWYCRLMKLYTYELYDARYDKKEKIKGDGGR